MVGHGWGFGLHAAFDQAGNTMLHGVFDQVGDRAHQVIGSHGRHRVRRADINDVVQALERLTDISAPVPALESLTERELEIVDGVKAGDRKDARVNGLRRRATSVF